MKKARREKESVYKKEEKAYMFNLFWVLGWNQNRLNMKAFSSNELNYHHNLCVVSCGKLSSLVLGFAFRLKDF